LAANASIMDQSGQFGQLKRLSPRQVECLSLVAQNHSSKEIARLLKLSVHTVNSYISEGVEALGLSNRREAARLIQSRQHEIEHPYIIGSESMRVTDPAILLDELVGDELVSHLVISELSSDKKNEVEIVTDAFFGFHLFRGARSHNTLSIVDRVIWIVSVAVGLAVLLSTSVMVIDTITRLSEN
jgi:DNA-binding CsgD family transcriptional regulator